MPAKLGGWVPLAPSEACAKVEKIIGLYYKQNVPGKC